jgi:hypothetical protein
MADNWGPLLAIADAAGGDWPERARQALLRAVATAEDGNDGSLREVLLADIRDVFSGLDNSQSRFFTGVSDEILDRDRIRSADLAGTLARMEGHPWAEFGPTRRPITANALARLLRPFRIEPETRRFQTKSKDSKEGTFTAKGYLRGQFADAFARYLPSLIPPDQTVTTSQCLEIKSSQPNPDP